MCFAFVCLFVCLLLFVVLCCVDCHSLLYCVLVYSQSHMFTFGVGGKFIVVHGFCVLLVSCVCLVCVHCIVYCIAFSVVRI